MKKTQELFGTLFQIFIGILVGVIITLTLTLAFLFSSSQRENNIDKFYQDHRFAQTSQQYNQGKINPNFKPDLSQSK